MNDAMKNIKTTITILLVGIIGFLIGALIFGEKTDTKYVKEHLAEKHLNDETEELFICSMHPHIKQEEPGNCPICGMELVSVTAENSTFNSDELVMSPVAVKLAEIATTKVQKQSAIKEIPLAGKVSINQNKSSAITSHVSGRIIELYIAFDGAYVEAGQRVASIYSPELIAAQQELFETAKYKEQNAVLYEAAKRKLELWELPTSTIKQIETGNTIMESIDIYSPVSGFVQQVNVQPQQHVASGSIMYQVVDLSSVWVMFDVYESDIANVNVGQHITFRVSSIQGKVFKGVIDFIDPIIQNAVRSSRVRVQIDNSQHQLKPNMLAEGIVKAPIGKEKQVLIPRSAIMWTGNRSIVFLKKQGVQKPTFLAKEITLGTRVGNQYVVLEGVNEGDEIVSNGTFKLDSAAQLADKLSMMNRDRPKKNKGSAQNFDEIQSSLFVNEEHLDSLILNYMKITAALAADDYDSAKLMLLSFEKQVYAYSENPTQQTKEDTFNALVVAVAEANNATTIKELRMAFIEITNQLYTAVKNIEYDNDTLYVQFCPMFDNGSGGRWLSLEKNIKNPYFGLAMLTCGNTLEVIGGN